VVRRRATDPGYHPGKHAATRQVALLPPTDRPVESLDPEGAEAVGVAVEEAAGLPAVESGPLAAVAPPELVLAPAPGAQVVAFAGAKRAAEVRAGSDRNPHLLCV